MHNACSYGHFEVTELLIRHGGKILFIRKFEFFFVILLFYYIIILFDFFNILANVGAMDLWQFSPLHEAASKSRTEVCSLLLSHGKFKSVMSFCLPDLRK